MIVGLDIGGTNIRALLIRPDTGEIIDRSQESSAGNEDQLLSNLTDIIESFSEKSEQETE